MLSLLSAGSNARGQLGNTETDDSHVFRTCSFSDGILPSQTMDVVDVSNGANHTLVLLKMQMAGSGEPTTEVWGCGDGRVGQLGPKLRQQEPITVFHKLGLEDPSNKLFPERYTIKSIGATWETSYLVVERCGGHDVIISFGSNDFGDLGIGRDVGDEMIEKGTGFHIVDFSHISVAGKSIDSAKIVDVEALQTGQRHVIASLKVVWDEREPMQIIIGWGACRYGQLGDMMNLPNQSKAKTKNCAVSTPTYCSRPILLYVSDSPSTFITDCSLGIHHSVFLHVSGRVLVKGSNRKGQIQGLENLQHIRDIKCTWNGTYVLTTDNPRRLLSTGSNSHGQLGRTENSSTLQVEVTHASIKALACGSEHSLIITASEKGDEVWGWGWNEHGNLGLGHTIDQSAPQKLWPCSDGRDDSGACVHGIWGGNGTSWIFCEIQTKL